MPELDRVAAREPAPQGRAEALSPPRVPRREQVQSGYELPCREVRLGRAQVRLFTFPGGLEDPSRAVVCMPGLAASGRSFAKLSPLSDQFQFLLWTPPFHTPMGHAPLEFNLEALSHADAPLPRRFALLGSSYGTLIALGFALRHPSRVSALVLVSPVTSARGIRLGAVLAESALRIPLPFAYFLAPAMAQVLGGSRLSREGRAEIVREARRLGPLEMARRVRDILKEPLSNFLEQVEAPTLVLQGQRDRVLPLSAAREVARRIPGARLELIKGAGHLPYMTHPDEFNRRVGNFLRSNLAINL